LIKRKLPVGGVQTFSKIRDESYIYVDKTMHVYDIVSKYNVVLLSRPRRFGKSLLCSTFESLFRGEKDLFDGLAISKTDWNWKTNPVIHLGLGGEDFTSEGVNALTTTLNTQLDKTCDDYGITVDKGEFLADRFNRVIMELAKKIDKVVIIIDEYDNPMMNTIDQPEQYNKIRERLKGFYSVIKQNDKYLRFAFVTGVTKFSQVSMFSGFNQPNDISMMAEYNDICGISQSELENNFSPEIEAYAPKHGGREKYIEKLREYYNGYHFAEKRPSVYNTYGILNHFDKNGKFEPFWSKSGTPTLALKYFESKNVNVAEIEEAKMKAADFSDYRDDTITLFPLLYQTGYLTIADYNENTGYYKLNYPNVEVRQSLAEFLSGIYSRTDNTLKNSASEKFIKSLQEGKTEIFLTLLKSYLNKVDYELSSKITEYYFEFAVSNIINMLGLECKNEVHTANGRMDSVIFTEKIIYILEFKIDDPSSTSAADNALWQIEDKDYASIFKDSGKQIIKVGVVFSRKLRNIVEWKIG